MNEKQQSTLRKIARRDMDTTKEWLRIVGKPENETREDFVFAPTLTVLKLIELGYLERHPSVNFLSVKVAGKGANWIWQNAPHIFADAINHNQAQTTAVEPIAFTRLSILLNSRELDLLLMCHSTHLDMSGHRVLILDQGEYDSIVQKMRSYGGTTDETLANSILWKIGADGDEPGVATNSADYAGFRQTEPTPTPGIIATIEQSLEVVTDESEREQLYTDLIAAWEDLQAEIEMEAQARTERNTHRETLMVVPDMEVTKRVILAEPEPRPLKSRTPHDLIYGVWHSMQATQDLFHITMQFRAYCKAHGMDYDTLRDELVYEITVGNPKGYTRKVQNLTEAETVTFVREIEKRMVETHER